MSPYRGEEDGKEDKLSNSFSWSALFRSYQSFNIQDFIWTDNRLEGLRSNFLCFDNFSSNLRTVSSDISVRQLDATYQIAAGLTNEMANVVLS